MAHQKQASPDSQQIISAQVVVRAASGRSVRDQPITTANLQEYAPTPESVSAARQIFASAGFEVGVLVGTSFSITATVARFEQFFVVRLVIAERSAIKALTNDRHTSFELPLHAIGQDLVKHIETVTFTPPPDFGPTHFS